MCVCTCTCILPVYTIYTYHLSHYTRSGMYLYMYSPSIHHLHVPPVTLYTFRYVPVHVFSQYTPSTRTTCHTIHVPVCTCTCILPVYTIYTYHLLHYTRSGMYLYMYSPSIHHLHVPPVTLYTFRYYLYMYSPSIHHLHVPPVTLYTFRYVCMMYICRILKVAGVYTFTLVYSVG